MTFNTETLINAGKTFLMLFWGIIRAVYRDQLCGRPAAGLCFTGADQTHPDNSEEGAEQRPRCIAGGCHAVLLLFDNPGTGRLV